jgi:DNA-binding phage protein
MTSDGVKRRVRKYSHDVREVARAALLQLLEPLVEFVLDSGLNTHELHSILRAAAVRSVAARQMEIARKVNISGIAASTGIPRAEISRILKSPPNSAERTADRQHQATNRILAAWHQDPKFTTPEGQPANLKIYGRGSTFETLVHNHGRGIPSRAILDELTRAGAAEVLPSRLIRVRTSVTVDRGMTTQGIRSFGLRAAELLATMLQNMRNPENPQFVASISESNIATAFMPLFRKELAGKGADFLADMQESLLRGAATAHVKKDPPRTNRASVTIFYHETSRKAKRQQGAAKKRRNFSRDD